MNLISHDCHSYLCLTLANGSPHRKAMVMAGENVSNDVDEEVCVSDGVIGHEAHEASAGDRRAIADADQAGQLDISGETRAARALRTPEPPTDATRMIHNTTHVPISDLTAKRQSSTCSELRMFHLCASLVNRYFALIPDREVRAAKLTSRWISGCWWRRDASVR